MSEEMHLLLLEKTGFLTFRRILDVIAMEPSKVLPDWAKGYTAEQKQERLMAYQEACRTMRRLITRELMKNDEQMRWAENNALDSDTE